MRERADNARKLCLARAGSKYRRDYTADTREFLSNNFMRGGGYSGSLGIHSSGRVRARLTLHRKINEK